MISLALRGKISITEDVLTAAIFDYFRTSPTSEGIQCVFNKARSFGQPLTLPEFDATDVELWPTNAAGEPDARVILSKNGQVVCRAVVEAKLGSKKSGLGELTEDLRRGDQLARYLLAESEHGDGIPVLLLYITHHSVFPWKDIEESISHLAQAKRPDLATCILWMSWRDMPGVLESLSSDVVLTDLKQLLARAGMARFYGIKHHPFAVTGRPKFYLSARSHRQPREAEYLRMIGPLVLEASETWRYERRARRQKSWNWPTAMGNLADVRFYTSREGIYE